MRRVNFFVVPFVVAMEFVVQKFLVPKFNLAVVKNPGLIGGIDLPGIFDALAIFLLLLIFVILYFRSFNSKTDLGFALIVGGALANLLDRAHDGTVTDYLYLGISTANLADIAIMLGMLIILVQNIKHKSQKYTQKSADF